MAAVSAPGQRRGPLVLAGVDLARHLTEELVELAADPLCGEALADRLPGVVGQPRLLVWLLPDPSQEGRPLAVIPTLNDVPVLPGGDDLGDAARARRGNGNAAPRHRLYQ